MQKYCNIKDIKHWGGVYENVQLGPEDQYCWVGCRAHLSPTNTSKIHQQSEQLSQKFKLVDLLYYQSCTENVHVSGQKWEKKRYQNGTGTLGGICEEGKVHTSRLSPGESLCLFRGLLGHIERLEEPGFCLQRVYSCWPACNQREEKPVIAAATSLKHVKRGC